MQNIHGKEIDLLRTTVKVPGKRLPRATPATAPGTSPRANGLSVERSNTQLGGGTGEAAAEVGPAGWLLWSPGRHSGFGCFSAWAQGAGQHHTSRSPQPKTCALMQP